MPFDIEMQWSLEPPGLVARFTPDERHQGPHKNMHGGVSAYVLDETMAALGQTLDKVHLVTGTLTLKYRKPVPIDGREIRVEAWREGEPRRAMKVFGRIVTADDLVCVEATGLFLRVDGV